ncbi:MAG: hypothetical protein SOZ23_05600 [Methanosphaera sp.]|uniref:hypothetical protein n=1 Tax=Methanosphaera sp. TaxID=2666342 RepID=UPI0025CD9233|nr:hypothetical protein [Methanosphaera sp.]MCI5867000.1 hypothetical protein [Methanosphaera sp.]MDD6533943.1 hypothetical protein [Methanosphaera sp.]MDY3956247.1 hypothetical protein [Methanosphaera sp.]
MDMNNIIIDDELILDTKTSTIRSKNDTQQNNIINNNIEKIEQIQAQVDELEKMTDNIDKINTIENMSHNPGIILNIVLSIIFILVVILLVI